MVRVAHPVDPFAEVDVCRSPSGGSWVTAKIAMLLQPLVVSRCGLALDASAGMRVLYGTLLRDPGPPLPNLMEPAARFMVNFLSQFADDDKVSLLYWAVDADGSGIEKIGRFSGDEIQSVAIGGPNAKRWGRGTKLLPALRYFVETAFEGATSGIGVFVTDGIIEDIADVKTYCVNFGRQIAAGQRKPCKFLLLGLGCEVDESQMEALSDMFEGSGLETPEGDEIDLWDHKFACEMQKLAEVFTEAVLENVTVVASGKIVDQKGRVARDFPNGVPAFLHFELPADAISFSLEFPGGSINQDISEAMSHARQ